MISRGIEIQIGNLAIKKRLWRRCFSVNFAKFLRTRPGEELLGIKIGNELNIYKI